MGYCTKFDLSVCKTNEKSELLRLEHEEAIANLAIKTLRESSNNAEYALDEEGYSNDSCKWYDHDKDMIAISEAFPECLFILHGEGEESGDLWNKYYYQGKMQDCPAEVKYEPFNINELR